MQKRQKKPFLPFCHMRLKKLPNINKKCTSTSYGWHCVKIIRVPPIVEVVKNVRVPPMVEVGKKCKGSPMVGVVWEHKEPHYG